MQAEVLSQCGLSGGLGCSLNVSKTVGGLPSADEQEPSWLDLTPLPPGVWLWATQAVTPSLCHTHKQWESIIQRSGLESVQRDRSSLHSISSGTISTRDDL